MTVTFIDGYIFKASFRNNQFKQGILETSDKLFSSRIKQYYYTDKTILLYETNSVA